MHLFIDIKYFLNTNNTSYHIVEPAALRKNFGTMKTKTVMDWGCGNVCNIVWTSPKTYDVEIDLENIDFIDLERVILAKAKITDSNKKTELKRNKLIVKEFEVK